MISKAATVAEYLAELPEDRRKAIEAVRRVIRKNLGKGYEEGMQYGAIGYYVPHKLYPPGYHCDPRQPLPFAGLGSQKNYMSFGLMCVYYRPESEALFRSEWAATGKKLDMGKVCIRFKKLDDVPLEVIGSAVARVPVAQFIEFYEAAIQKNRERRAGAKASAGAKSVPAKKKAAVRKKVRAAGKK